MSPHPSVPAPADQQATLPEIASNGRGRARHGAPASRLWWMALRVVGAAACSGLAFVLLGLVNVSLGLEDYLGGFVFGALFVVIVCGAVEIVDGRW